jgi:hypothetical protein
VSRLISCSAGATWMSMLFVFDRPNQEHSNRQKENAHPAG